MSSNRPKHSSKANNNYVSAIKNRSSLPEYKTPKKQVIGNYVLGKTVGEGTFGKVKLAIHLPTGEKVAVKILEKDRIKDQEDIKRVNREIKILKKARHSNIIQLYEVVDTSSTIYLIMECAEGGEMFDYIVSQKHVNENQSCKFLHQIVDGVEVLHNHDITHRDLKPENLLLKSSSSGWLLKIVDFGLSNTHEGGKLLSTACGSPCYAAPEMIAGKKYEGPLADIWSIGVILFALVSGFLPFEDPNTSVLYRKILSGEYKTPKWLSNDVKDLIRKILEIEPKKRFRINDIRKHTWFNAVHENDVPKEYLTSNDSVAIRNEAIKAVTDSGMDYKQILDQVNNNSCNSQTATFYLYEQKFRNKKIKNRDNENVKPILPASVQPVDTNTTVNTNEEIHDDKTVANVITKVDDKSIDKQVDSNISNNKPIEPPVAQPIIENNPLLLPSIKPKLEQMEIKEAVKNIALSNTKPETRSDESVKDGKDKEIRKVSPIQAQPINQTIQPSKPSTPQKSNIGRRNLFGQSIGQQTSTGAQPRRVLAGQSISAFLAGPLFGGRSPSPNPFSGFSSVQPGVNSTPLNPITGILSPLPANLVKRPISNVETNVKIQSVNSKPNAPISLMPTSTEPLSIPIVDVSGNSNERPGTRRSRSRNTNETDSTISSEPFIPNTGDIPVVPHGSTAVDTNINQILTEVKNITISASVNTAPPDLNKLKNNNFVRKGRSIVSKPQSKDDDVIDNNTDKSDEISQPTIV